MPLARRRRRLVMWKVLLRTMCGVRVMRSSVRSFSVLLSVLWKPGISLRKGRPVIARSSLLETWLASMAVCPGGMVTVEVSWRLLRMGRVLMEPEPRASILKASLTDTSPVRRIWGVAVRVRPRSSN